MSDNAIDAMRLVVALVALAAADVADIGPDGTARAAEWISVPLRFNDKDTVDVDIGLGEDAVAAALRYVYDVAKKNDAGFARRIAEVMEEASKDTPVPATRANALASANATRLKTAGKHKKRAEEAREDRPRSAAADYLRAARRKGIEKNVEESYMKEVAACMKEDAKMQEELAKEAAERAVYDARMAREAASRDAAAARRKAAEAGLRALLDAEEHSAKPGDAFASNARSCAARARDRPCDVTELFKGGHAFAGDPKLEFDAATEALEATGDAEEALAHVARCHAASDATNKEAVEGLAQRCLDAATAAAKSVDALRRALAPDNVEAGKDWAAAAEFLKSLVRSGRPLKWAVWLARARLVLGDAGGAEQVAGAALQALEKYDKKAMRTPFVVGEPKTLALTIGAAAALERGRLDKATRFVQAGLRHDPDSIPLRTQYDGLKGLQRRVEAIDKQLKKGMALKAVDALDEAYGALDALGEEFEGSRLEAYRATLYLRSCHAFSRVRRHELAKPACDAAVAQGEVSGESASAYAARAAALERDDAYDDATRDWRTAVENSGGERADPERLSWTDDAGDAFDLRRRLHDCRRLEDQWEKRRDHGRVLDLPANVDQLRKESKCKWLKKQHKKLARRWHPDKARGDPKRAARKMGEVSEAKEALSKAYGC